LGQYHLLRLAPCLPMQAIARRIYQDQNLLSVEGNIASLAEVLLAMS